MEPEASAVQEALANVKDRLKIKRQKVEDFSLAALTAQAAAAVGNEDDEEELEEDGLLDWRFKK